MKEQTVRDYDFSIDYSLDVIRGKWKALIIWKLRHEVKRFTKLERLLLVIKRKVLVMQLKDLELNGIIIRKAYPVVPPKVEYRLTDSGKDLVPLFESLAGWAKQRLNIIS